MIIEPKVEEKSLEYEPAKFILLSDQSASVLEAFKGDSSAFSKYQDKIKALKNSIEDQFNIIHYGFDQDLDSADYSANGKNTNLHKALQKVAYQTNGQNIAGMGILSDGILNDGNNPIYEEYPIQSPIYTLGLGDTSTKKDVAIQNIEHHDLIYLNNDFEVKVDIQWSKVNSLIPIEISQIKNGKKEVIHKENFIPEKNKGIQNFSFILSPKEEGIKEYQVSIPKLSNEKNTINNTANFFVEIIDGKQNILIISGQTSPDIKSLKSAINSNDNFDCESVLLKDIALSKIEKKYDLAILLHPNKNTLKLRNIYSYLNKNKISTWLFISNYNEYSYYRSAKGNKPYPNIDFLKIQGPNTNQVRAKSNSLFLPFNLSKATLRTITELPELVGFSGMDLKLNENQVLLKQKIGSVETTYPLLYFNDDQDQKLGIFFGKDIWKWRLNDFLINGHHEATNELISKSVQYLANKTDKRKFKLIDNKKIYNENEEILIKAKLYNDNYEAVLDEQIDFELKNEKGQIFEYQFTPFSNDYRLSINGFEEGKYQYTAKCKNYPYAPITGYFHIEAFEIEKFSTKANHELLKEISYQYNGRFYTYADWDNFKNSIQNLESKDTIYHKSQKTSIIHFKWIFFLLILSLSIEWVMRKFLGGY